MEGRSFRSVARTRSTLSRARLRVLFALVVVLAGLLLVAGATDGISTATEADVPRAEPRDGHTVVTESGRAGTIVAYRPDGELLYYNNSRTKYFDVDPVEGEALTVEYAATDTLYADPACDDPPCVRNVVERANLSTGEVEVLYERYDYKEFAGEWHDVDRINETHFLVADIVADQVFVVNTETELVEWLWDVQSEFAVEAGGPYPRDWVHVNDVEYLPDGRIMVSLRNLDQVVFVDPSSGLVDDWTLGTEDDHDVLFEQHNPDYIPAERGGPAVVVSDSENGRVQEFQREDGEWVRTWEWADDRLQWPRDADRLPNGNTLVTDTHGKRVVEVAPDGEIVWQVESTLPYDAERLETGDESTGGESARALGLESRTDGAPDDAGVLETIGTVVKRTLPSRIVNAILFVTPPWMRAAEFGALGVGVLAGLSWTLLETRWFLRDAGIGFRRPVYRRGDDEE